MQAQALDQDYEYITINDINVGVEMFGVIETEMWTEITILGKDVYNEVYNNVGKTVHIKYEDEDHSIDDEFIVSHVAIEDRGSKYMTLLVHIVEQ